MDVVYFPWFNKVGEIGAYQWLHISYDMRNPDLLEIWPLSQIFFLDDVFCTSRDFPLRVNP